MEERTAYRRNRRKRRRRRRGCARVLFGGVFAILIGVGLYFCLSSIGQLHLTHHWELPFGGPLPETEFQETVAAFAEEHDLSMREWPGELLEMGEKNPEAQQFVLDYPLKKEMQPEIDLSVYANYDTVPLFLQWDERWGYSQYAGGLLGMTGCGPTCLSMVSIYLLNNPAYSPQYVAQFSMNHGYSVKGNGSSWTLISEGGPKLGLDVIEIPLDENRITQNLMVGNPIICVMGPGDFTTTGHFIVMTGYEDGKIKVNDPNSPRRSEELWEYDRIQSQIRNLWVCRKP